jgi:hypothetical protein
MGLCISDHDLLNYLQLNLYILFPKTGSVDQLLQLLGLRHRRYTAPLAWQRAWTLNHGLVL